MFYFSVRGDAPTNDLQRADWQSMRAALAAVPKPAGIGASVGVPRPAPTGTGYVLDVEMAQRHDGYVHALQAAMPASVTSGLHAHVELITSTVDVSEEPRLNVSPGRLRELRDAPLDPAPPGASDDGWVWIALLFVALKPKR